jgi:hypothetical protein
MSLKTNANLLPEFETKSDLGNLVIFSSKKEAGKMLKIFIFQQVIIRKDPVLETNGVEFLWLY